MQTWLKWPIALCSLAVFLGLVYLVHVAVQTERKEEEGGDAVKAPSRREPGNRVKLGEKTARAWGVEDAPAQPISWTPKILVYGRVVPNPRATFEVRAPFAGMLREAPEKPWPYLGKSVAAKQVLGVLDIRLGPQERLDLGLKLKEAQAKEKGAEDVFHVLQERLKGLESASISVARTDLDKARVDMLQARTELAGARAAVAIWKEALDEINQPDRKGDIWSYKLRLAPGEETELEITELLARPGMAVEAGAAIARAVDFNKPLVRLDVPIVAGVNGIPQQMEIVQAPSGGLENQLQVKPTSAQGKLAGRAPQVDASSQLAGIWYEIEDRASKIEKRGTKDRSLASWRPGLFVQAFLTDPKAKPLSVVKVKDTALLYHQGRALVYVRIGPGRYQRREVRVLGRDGAFWVLGSGVQANEPVVFQHAQILLAEEFRS
jgi:hypothetical protein